MYSDSQNRYSKVMYKHNFYNPWLFSLLLDIYSLQKIFSQEVWNIHQNNGLNYMELYMNLLAAKHISCFWQRFGTSNRKLIFCTGWKMWIWYTMKFTKTDTSLIITNNKNFNQILIFCPSLSTSFELKHAIKTHRSRSKACHMCHNISLYYT